MAVPRASASDAPTTVAIGVERSGVTAQGTGLPENGALPDTANSNTHSSMARFIIRGQRTLSGTLQATGNKNAALPMIAAALLTDEPVALENVPDIVDARVMLEILGQLGVSHEWRGRSLIIHARDVRSTEPDAALSRRVRGSILFAGPLLARCGSVSIPGAGGDAIGRRRLDTHFFGLCGLGAEMDVGPQSVRLRAKNRLRGGYLLLDEASVTATENLIMAAALAAGRTEIFNAACEPHVQDLCHLLNQMGARITGIGTNRLFIDGVARLHGCQHRIEADYMEAASYLAAAALTGGALRVEGMTQSEVAPVLRHGFGRLGVEWEEGDGAWTLPAGCELRVKPDLSSAIPKIEDGIWPAFPSDLLSVLLVLATQAKGSVLFFEKMFESRLYFVDRLIEMGAAIVQCDPHRVVITGPSPLQGNLVTSPDIRAGMALILAALCARGESVIENAQMIDRGYEAIEQKLRALGADIVREG